MKTLFNNEFKEFNKSIFKYLIFTTIVFFSTLIITRIFFEMKPQHIETLLDSYLSASSLSSFDENNKWMFLIIFFKNTIVCLVTVFGGLIPFIFFPTIRCIRNSYFIGLILAALKVEQGNTLLISIIGLVPHGIFEVPAILYTVSIGTYLCTSNTRSILGGPKANWHISEVKKAFIYLIVPLLFIASLIEALLVPHLIDIFIYSNHL